MRQEIRDYLSGSWFLLPIFKAANRTINIPLPNEMACFSVYTIRMFIVRKIELVCTSCQNIPTNAFFRIFIPLNRQKTI